MTVKEQLRIAVNVAHGATRLAAKLIFHDPREISYKEFDNAFESFQLATTRYKTYLEEVE